MSWSIFNWFFPHNMTPCVKSGEFNAFCLWICGFFSAIISLLDRKHAIKTSGMIFSLNTCSLLFLFFKKAKLARSCVNFAANRICCRVIHTAFLLHTIRALVPKIHKVRSLMQWHAAEFSDRKRKKKQHKHIYTHEKCSSHANMWTTIWYFDSLL